MTALTVVSLFSGAGGSSLGYKLSGYEPRLAVEWDDHAAACYRLNFPSTPLYHGDVAALSDEEALRLTGLEPGELDVLDGSPPCQGFSLAGGRQVADNRNHLFSEYVRLIRAFRPRAFVMENVPGLLGGKMKLIFLDIMVALRASGYRVKCAILNAADYGVPQARRRTIFIGFREDLGLDPTFPPPTVEKHVTVGEALGASCSWRQTGGQMGSYKESVAGGIVQGLGWFSGGRNEQHPPHGLDKPALTVMRHGIGPSGQHQYQVAVQGTSPLCSLLPAPPLSGKALQVARALKKGCNGSSINGLDGWWNTCRLTDKKPSPTITKVGGLYGKYAKLIHHAEVRGLSVGEVMRLQSFPDDYQWPEGTTWVTGWARVGNSVPPFMMAAISSHVGSFLQEGGRP